MKKTLKQRIFSISTALLLSIVVLGLLAACTNRNSSESNTSLIKNATSSMDSTSTTNNLTSNIKFTVEQAKEKALKESNSGQLIGYESDVEFGKSIFEIFILDGQIEKEYKIDAQTGEVLKIETKYLGIDPEDKMLINAKPEIDLAMAEIQFKEKYPKATLKKLKLEVENNVLVYEVSAIEDHHEIEVTIDASTGTFIQEEIETDND